METERPVRSYGFRIVVLLAVLANLILVIALITQVRELQQRVAEPAPRSRKQARRRHATTAAGSRNTGAELCRVP